MISTLQKISQITTLNERLVRHERFNDTLNSTMEIVEDPQETHEPEDFLTFRYLGFNCTDYYAGFWNHQDESGQINKRNPISILSQSSLLNFECREVMIDSGGGSFPAI
jgi:hypothetical protein